MKEDQYTQKLESVIKQMIRPIKGVPFKLVIEGLSGKKILPFNTKNPKDISLLNNLKIVANNTLAAVNKKGIISVRPNEVGNYIEPLIKRSLANIGYPARTPFTKSGKKKSSGYPDIEFVDNFKRLNYLESKTYNIKNISTTQRTFYLSPSEDFKVTQDAHHFMFAFEIYVVGRRNKKNMYKCKAWKILTLEYLFVDVKYEFNTDNRKLYKKEFILAESSM